MSTSNENVLEAKAILSFEETNIKKTSQLIEILAGLQKNLNMAQSAALLQKSLQCIKSAETNEEMEVYRLSFMAALETIKIKDLLDVDSCINDLRACADDLFYWTNLEADAEDKKIKTLGGDVVVDDTLKTAEKTVNVFMQSSKLLQEEFEQKIKKNNSQILTLNKALNIDLGAPKENYLVMQTKISELQHLNMKYQAGIKRIETQKVQITHALEIAEKIPTVTSTTEQAKTKRQNLRADFAMALHDIQLTDQRSGINHFINQCKRNVNALCSTRASYLKKEETPLKSLGKTIWRASALFLPMLPVPSVPQNLTSFVHESIDVSAELSEKIVKPEVIKELRKQNTVTPPRLSPLKKAGRFINKAVSVLLGGCGFALSALFCMTWIGIPKGLAIASMAIDSLNAVAKGSDYFTEAAKGYKYRRKVTETLNSLEKDHAQLQQQCNAMEKTTRTSIAKKNMQQLSSESKIDLLLMGHKPGDLLSEAEIAKINQVHDVPDPEEQPKSQSIKTAQSSFKVVERIAVSEEGEGESDIRPHGFVGG